MPSHDRSVVIAIDGPSGAGKSTVARLLARQLGFLFLDTGAMYRAVAYEMQQRGIPMDEAGAARLVPDLRLRFSDDGERIFIRYRDEEEQDVSGPIRTREVTADVSKVAALRCVREKLTHEQRQLANERSVVAEGRDTATVVFPGADRKFFLTASLETRAHRRKQERSELAGLTIAEVAAEIAARDNADSERELAPLVPAPDAIRIETTDESIPEVVARLAAHCQGLPVRRGGSAGEL